MLTKLQIKAPRKGGCEENSIIIEDMSKNPDNKNANLHAARGAKNDEFYTWLGDISSELSHYVDEGHFTNKVILLPCDESEHTNFFKYFDIGREKIQWKKIIAIGYRTNREAEVHILENTGDGVKESNHVLKGNGDFRLEETQKYFEEADVVVTNPPFSLFREFTALLEEKGKKYAIIGPQNALTYKDFFPLICDNKVWTGYNHPKSFADKQNGMKPKKFGNICWYTNLDIPKRKYKIVTNMTYEKGLEEGLYQKYDGTDIINVDRLKDIPMDYEGIMGVPITFIDKHNPNQFEILGIANSARYIGHECLTIINGKKIYNRILIRKKK